MNSKKVLVVRYFSFVAAFSIMLTIFIMSSQNAEESSTTSRGFIRMIAPYLKKNFYLLSEEKQAAFVSSLQYIVRKGAHFSIYTFLGAFISCGFLTYKWMKPLSKTGISFIICVLYSLSDEIHQHFVPGRSCELFDVFIDSSGAILGCLTVFLIYKFIKRKACRV